MGTIIADAISNYDTIQQYNDVFLSTTGCFFLHKHRYLFSLLNIISNNNKHERNLIEMH